MGFNREHILAMVPEKDNYLDTDQIAEHFGVHSRTIERLIENYRKKLKKHRKRRGRKILYPLDVVLKIVKLHIGIEKEHVPSAAIKKARTEQRIRELEAELQAIKASEPDF